MRIYSEDDPVPALAWTQSSTVQGHSASIPLTVATMIRLRGIECELGLLERADGSARLVQGGTAALCAVYGPADVRVSKEDCEQ